MKNSFSPSVCSNQTNKKNLTIKPTMTKIVKQTNQSITRMRNEDQPQTNRDNN